MAGSPPRRGMRAAAELARAHSAHVTGLCLAIEPAMPATTLGMVPPELIASQHGGGPRARRDAIAAFQLALERALAFRTAGIDHMIGETVGLAASLFPWLSRCPLLNWAETY